MCVYGDPEPCGDVECQDLVEMWEPSGVPPQGCAAQEDLEICPVHTKLAGQAPEYRVFF